MLPERVADDRGHVRLDIIGGPMMAWVHALRSAAAGRISIGVAPPKGSRGWLHLLQQALAPDSIVARPALASPDAPIDRADPVERWQFEDGSGFPLFSPFFAARAWQRPPHVMSLRLVAQRSGQRFILAEACVGTGEGYIDLLRQLARIAVVLLAKVLSGAAPEEIPLIERSPDGREAMLAGAMIGGAIRRQVLRYSRRLAVETWAVGIVERPIAQVVASGVLGAVSWLRWDDRKGYLADPFPWPGRSDRFFCERYSTRSGIGDLVAVDEHDAACQTRIELPETRHVSYPGVWREGDELLLLPESGASRRTVIYRLDDEARVQGRITVAEDCGMADPTLFRKDGLYWIAYTDTDIGLYDNLCLMYAARLQGPWQRHPGNPVKLDIRSSRPAGTVFQLGGDWLRPAQDCAADYGAALAINRIVELTPNRFREEVVMVLRPDPKGPYPHGLHTLSVWGDRLLIDGKRWQRRPQLLMDKIRKRLRRPADS